MKAEKRKKGEGGLKSRDPIWQASYNMVQGSTLEKPTLTLKSALTNYFHIKYQKN